MDINCTTSEANNTNVVQTFDKANNINIEYITSKTINNTNIEPIIGKIINGMNVEQTTSGTNNDTDAEFTDSGINNDINIRVNAGKLSRLKICKSNLF